LIRVVAETGSTNADIAHALQAGQLWPEGDWLVADRQTTGRGRLGREWCDGAGNFMGSTVVHRRHGDPAAASLALMSGLALHEAVSGCLAGAGPVTLKWPNDVMAGSAKLAGILLEARQDSVIIGIGVNLVGAPKLPDRKTVSLADLGAAPPRDEFAGVLAEVFARELERWRTAGTAPLFRRWQAAAHPVGTALTVNPPGEAPVSGRFAGLADDGNLRLGLADGSIRTVHAGDVLLDEGDQAQADRTRSDQTRTP